MAKATKAPAAGYSGTPLAVKLGQKTAYRALFVGMPAQLAPALTAPKFMELRETPSVTSKTNKGPFEYVHLFVTKRAALASALPMLQERLSPDGMIWVSWPKKASKVETDITEDTIREICLPIGLVDVKVCAVDETWSGLKLMIRKELRAKQGPKPK